MPPIGNCQSELKFLKENKFLQSRKERKRNFPINENNYQRAKDRKPLCRAKFHHYFKRQVMRNAVKICFNGMPHRSMIAENSLIKIFQFIDEENLTKISPSFARAFLLIFNLSCGWRHVEWGSEVSSFKDVVYVANAALVYNEHYQKYFLFSPPPSLPDGWHFTFTCVISHSSSYLRCQNQRELFSLLMMIRYAHITQRENNIKHVVILFYELWLMYDIHMRWKTQQVKDKGSWKKERAKLHDE